MAGISHRQNVGLYVCLTLYLLGVLAMGVVARRIKRKAAPVAGALRGHFGGSFGGGLLFFTVFASVFSGYAVTGVPMEAQMKGYFVVRWMMGVTSCGLGMLLFYPRLRRLGAARGYLSPNDFITDRYGSSRLRLLCSVVACVPQLLNLTVQLVSFANLMEGFTLGALPGSAAMALLAFLVLVMEQMGGIHSVVLTDAVQGLVMIVGFTILPVVLAVQYGTLQELAPGDCATLGWVNRTGLESMRAAGNFDGVPLQCAPGAAQDAECEPFGCLMATNPQFFTYPSRAEQSAFLFFVLNLLAFPLNPHMVQRVYAASSDSTLKHVVIALVLSVFLVNPPGIMAGLVVAAFGRSWPLAAQEGGTFSAVGNQLMETGPFEYALVAVLACGAVAALMSTADSVVLGVSNTLSIDIYNDWKKPEASPEQVVKFGGLISAFMLFAATIWGNFISADEFGTLLTWQTGLLLQLLPAYFLGLYSPVRARPIAAGIIVGVLALAGAAVWNPTVDYWHVPAPDVGVFANCIVVALVWLLSSRGGAEQSPASTGKFGEPLTLASIRSIMEGTREPFWPLLACMLALTLGATPVYGTPGERDSVTWGLPTWAFVVVVLTIAGVLLGVLAALTWKHPRDGSAVKDVEDLPAGMEDPSSRAAEGPAGGGPSAI